MKINEILDKSDPKQVEILNWFTDHGISQRNYVYKNGVVNNLEEDTIWTITSKPIETVPFKFGKVLSFNMSGQYIKSIDFFPEQASGFVSLVNCDRIESLEGIGTKVLKKMRGYLYLDNMNVKRNALGLLKIEGVQTLQCTSKKYPTWQKVVEILEKHLNKGNAGILEAQSELIDNDLDDYAEF